VNHPTSIAEEIARLHKLDVESLIQRFEELFSKPPRCRRKEWLFRKCAHQFQVIRFGGLSGAARARLDELIATLELPADASARTAVKMLKPAVRNNGLSVGTSLEREYKGKRILVRVVDGGFEAAGVLYKSLSAAACSISGQHVSGVAWFGLKPRKAAR